MFRGLPRLGPNLDNPPLPNCQIPTTRGRKTLILRPLLLASHQWARETDTLYGFAGSLGGRVARRGSRSPPVSPTRKCTFISILPCSVTGHEHLAPGSTIDTYRCPPSPPTDEPYAYLEPETLQKLYLTPTLFPAPILQPWDREAELDLPTTQPPPLQIVTHHKHKQTPPRPSLLSTSQITVPTPTPISPYPYIPGSSSGPPSPLSRSSTPSIYSTPSARSHTPPPLPLPAPTPSPPVSPTRATVRPKTRKILVAEDFKDVRASLRRVAAAPPAYAYAG